MYVGRKSRFGLHGWPSKAPLLLATLTMLAAVLVASGIAAGSPATDANATRVAPVLVPAARVLTEPADGATGVAPADPIRVAVAGGVLEALQLTNPDGRAVAGRFAPDRAGWTAQEPLGYDKTYSWSGTAVAPDGARTAVAGSFRTVAAKRLVGGRLNVADGGTYGVAMPVALTFSTPVANKAAVERALSVQTSPPVEGSWAWLGDDEVHWRPQSYYPANTQVSVTARLYGLALGGGTFGKADVASTFTIGRSLVLRGDTQAHRLRVFADGAQVSDYPASFGLDSDPGRVTRSGTHVVISKHSQYLMNNPAYGYEDFPVRWAVRISNNGEFTHAAPWSVGQQGRRNVSHGCVNLSPANAKAVYDAVLPGDPLEIAGSSQKLGRADGDYHDWTVPWQTWVGLSALS